VRSAIVLGLGLAAGCFRPDPVTGSPCSETQPCPEGLVCTLGTCQREPPGGGGDAPDARFCFGSGFVRVCLVDPPSAVLVLGADMTLDTDSSPLCSASDHPDLCVVAGTVVAVSGALRATGARPLVLLSASTLQVSGSVDVASRRSDATLGAGADSSDCATPPPDTTSGGPGGSFGGAGGAGASSSMGGGTAAPPAGAVSTVRGGCAGTAGGSIGSPGGAGGHGGGAVVLIAAALDVDGTLNASGAGGSGGTLGGFGGGGGSGGLIVLGADQVRIASTASVFANGGGGGASGAAGVGNPGQDPREPGTAAAGGTGISGSGGAGSVGARLDGVAGQDFGGGGGGAAGVIRVFGGGGATGNVSPPAS